MTFLMTNIVSLIFLKRLCLYLSEHRFWFFESIIGLFLFYWKLFQVYFGDKQRIKSVLNTSFLDSLSLFLQYLVIFFFFALIFNWCIPLLLCMHVSFLRNPWNKDLFLLNKLLLFPFPSSSFLPKALFT